jgi:hypothetical protein
MKTREVHDKYGYVVRLSVNELAFNGAAGAGGHRPRIRRQASSWASSTGMPRQAAEAFRYHKTFQSAHFRCMGGLAFGDDFGCLYINNFPLRIPMVFNAV